MTGFRIVWRSSAARKSEVRFANKQLRFGLGSPEGQYSMLWRVWVQGDEIYLAPRGMARLVKLSLHSSGIWRWAWVEKSVLDRELEGDRVHERWLKPSPFIPGWIVGPSVMFPWSPGKGWESDPIETTKDVYWLDPHRTMKKVTMSLMLAEPGVTSARDLREEKRFPLLAELILRSGGRVWVAARRDPMSLEDIRGVAVVQSKGMDEHAIGFRGTAVHLVKSNGAPLFVEMRVPKRKSKTKRGSD